MWVILTLVCAFSLATSDAFTKAAMRNGTDEYLAGWLRLATAAPPLLALLFFIEWPEVDGTFYLAVGVGMPLEVLAFAMYMRALRVSPMSLSLPFLAFTPVFLIGVGYLMLGETPSPAGIAGILLIAGGSYVLNLKHFRYGVMEPVKAIFRERGSVLMLSVALVYSVTASLVKVAINHSSPLFCGVVYFALFPLAYAPLALPRISRASFTKSGVFFLCAAGLLMAVMGATHALAVSLTDVAYMVAVKRTSLLMGVLYGCLLFREGSFTERTTGALLMLAGFAMVVVAG
jgi:drug/metabolite transporter (DMT)-like permease